MDPIIPRLRKDPFDDPAWTFEPKLDGFRGIADTIHGRILSRNRNRFSRFDHLLKTLPDGVVLDGEIVVLDKAGRPSFADLMRREGQPTYVPFDVMFVDAGYPTRAIGGAEKHPRQDRPPLPTSAMRALRRQRGGAIPSRLRTRA
jgi:ATP-dependent DNA ligase